MQINDKKLEEVYIQILKIAKKNKQEYLSYKKQLIFK